MPIKLLALLFDIFVVFGEEPPGTLTDLSECKVSHLGVEYSGQISKTESRVRCQSWTAKFPHKVREDLQSALFPEGSKQKASNFCRNPTKDSSMGPWCYTMSTDLQFETCGLPLCSYTECKITGPGIEYAGKIKKSVTGK